MNPEVWQRIQELYHSALERPQQERAAFLANACGGDTSLLREVESLLVYAGRADGLLESPAWTADSLEPGQVISHYRIVAKLGEGGMGVVWKAQDTELNRAVAIKSLPAEYLADESRRARFLQEARSASSLNHPNIVTIHDILNVGKATYIVMEFVDGKSLDQLIPKKGMRLGEALKVAIQIANALAAAHSIRIVHRDLKPANVMVTPSGHVKVLDFGLAKRVEPTDAAQSLTGRGAIVGTPGYMSPEQAEGRDIDTRSDIFSFGSLLYEMISGRRAFKGDSALSTMSAVLKDQPEPVPAAPPDLDKLLSRCLRKDPARRAQHMADVKVALEELKEDSESGSQVAPKVEASKSRRWRWAVAGFIILSGATAAYRFWPTAPAEAPKFQPVPITSLVGSETDPTLSPDGNQVAFLWDGERGDNADIYVKLVSGGPLLRLTTDPARDYAPSWSPDGGRIAFLRDDPSGGQSLMLIAPLGGPERKVVGVLPLARNTGLAWTPDSESIAFVDRALPSEAPSIFQISLVTGERRKLTTAPAGYWGDLHFSFSHDGRHLAFARYRHANEADLYVLDLRSGAEPRRLAPMGWTSGKIAWTPSGNDIIYSARGSLWRYPHRNAAAEPSAIAGSASAIHPSVSTSGRLVYAHRNLDTNIWRLDLASPGAAPTRVVASTRHDGYPQLSPDGTRLVFSSVRTGSREIWVSDSTGANSAQLTHLRGEAHSPKWSPDGTRIAFSFLSNGNRDIYTVDASGGSLRRLTTDPSEQGRPNWSRDGTSLYYYSTGNPMQIWRMAATGGPGVQVTTNGGHAGQESVDGKDLLYDKVYELGVFRRPLAGGEEVMFLDKARPGWWVPTTKGIYFAEVARWGGQVLAPPVPIRLWDYRTGKISAVAMIEKPIFMQTIGLSASLDGKVLVWEQIDQQDSDLMLVDNFR